MSQVNHPIMRTKQSILEDYSEMDIISMRDITHPEQKYIHFWDFMELNDKVHEFQARMGIAMRDLKKEMRQMYKNYYTRAIIQSPEKFLKHNRELQEIEYLMENPFFMAIIHFALTKNVDEGELRYWTIAYKKRLMEYRMDLKKKLEDEIKTSNGILVR